MNFIETCSIKINLSLRVLGKRGDGYHEIHSLFWRRSSPETLEVAPRAERDLLRVEGASIPGENLLTKTCAFLRARFGAEALPPLEMRLSKFLPMGSGIGAGSGNAAALLRWFERVSGRALPEPSEIGTLGADVAFLASRHDLALADGIGERLEGIAPDAGGLELPGVILFPQWSSDTREAYARIDRLREADAPALTPEEARRESLAVLEGLRERRRVGFLPNDFIPCQSDHLLCYNKVYSALEEAGALAWGLCGSGSSCFGLFASRSDLGVALTSRLGFSWLRKIMVVG